MFSVLGFDNLYEPLLHCRSAAEPLQVGTPAAYGLRSRVQF